MSAPNGTNIQTLLEEGLAALDAGKYETALECWNEVLARDPGNQRASRLVEELGLLIRDDGDGAIPEVSAGFVVVVGDDDIEPLASGPESESQHALERLTRLADEQAKENDKLRNSLGQREQDLLVLKEQQQAREQELVEAHGKTVELERQIGDLGARLRELESQGRQRERETADVELRLAERKMFERQTLEQMKEVTDERDAHSKEIRDLRDELDGLRAQHEQTSAEADLARTSQEDLRKELEETRDTLASTQGKADELSEELAEAKKAHDETRNAFAELDENTKKQIAGLDAEVAERGTRTESLTAELEAVQETRTASEQECATLREKREELEAALTAREAEIERVASELAETVETVQGQLEEAQEALRESQEARGSLRSEMAKAITEYEETHEKAVELEAKHEADAATLAEIRDELERTRDDAELAKTLQENLEAREVELAELAAAHDENVKRTGELEDQLQKAFAEHEQELEEAGATRAAEVAELAKTHTGEVESLVEQLSTAQAAQEEQRKELEALAGLQARVTELETELAAEAALAGEPAAALEEETQGTTEREQRIAELESRTTELSALADSRSEAVADAERTATEREQRIAELEAELSTNASRVAELEAAAAAVSGDAAAHETQRLENEDLRARLVEATALSTRYEQREGGLQEEIDSLKISLSAAEGRARNAETETEELRGRAEAPIIDMRVESDQTPAVETALPSPSAETPTENVVVSGAFRVAEEEEARQGAPPPSPPSSSAPAPPAQPPPIPGAQTAPAPDAASAENSPATRLRDASLAYTDRLSWLVDETPSLSAKQFDPHQDISSQAAFVLQVVDGNVSLADIIDIVGLPTEETSEILVDLLVRNIITTPSLQGRQ